MIYVRAELAPDAIRWGMRLNTTTAGFCSNCVGHCLQNMERGLNVRDVPFTHGPLSTVEIAARVD